MALNPVDQTTFFNSATHKITWWPHNSSVPFESCTIAIVKGAAFGVVQEIAFTNDQYFLFTHWNDNNEK